jgi:hypothetical protein
MRLSCFFIAALLVGLLAPRGEAAPPAELNELSMEVTALQTLFQLNLTSDQLDRLAELARGAADKRPREAASANAAVKETLVELYAALVRHDEKKVQALEEKFDGHFTKGSSDLDDFVSITDAARRKVAAVVRILRPSQVASFLGHYSDDWQGPITRMTEAVENGRKVSNEEWKSMGEEIADEVAWILVGADAATSKELKPRLVAILDRGRAISTKEWSSKKAVFENEVRKLSEKLSPVTALVNTMEHDLAELLSNPRLAEAIKARQAELAKAPTK